MHSTLGFEIAGMRRQAARWPGLGAVLALAAGGLCLHLGPPWPGAALAAILALAALAAWTGWRSGRCVESGRLRVDPSGQAHWVAASAADVPDRVAALAPWRWQLGSGEIWLLARDDRGRRLELRLDRRDCGDGQWRSLRRWLVWMGRAGSAGTRTCSTRPRT